MTDDSQRPSLTEELLRRAVAVRFDAREILLIPLVSVLFALVLGAVVMLATGVGP